MEKLIEITDKSPWDIVDAHKSQNEILFANFVSANASVNALKIKLRNGKRVIHCPLCYGYAYVHGQTTITIICPFCNLYARKISLSYPWIAFQRENAVTPWVKLNY